jgi:chaperone required for assembly of F1-ATPase
MSGGWKSRRFWTEATVAPTGNGFALHLDGRPARTPAKAPLVLPTAALAEAVASEWATQVGEIDPASMPLTRAANSAIDRVAPNRGEVARLIADHAGSDLICYRATEPRELIARQARVWDPLLAWAEQRFGLRPAVTEGIVHVAQPPEWIEATAREVGATDPFRMTGLYDLVAISGSFVIGFAVAEGAISDAEGWAASRIDEDWQVEQWGADDEALAAASQRRAAFETAARFWRLAGV